MELRNLVILTVKIIENQNLNLNLTYYSSLYDHTCFTPVLVSFLKFGQFRQFRY